jgi:hypothetical protein
VSHRVRRAATTWLLLATLAVLLGGLVYGVAQQGLRAAADDPQLQMADDAAAALDRGQSPAVLVAATDVDIARSLGLFTVVTDGAGSIVRGNGLLDGSPVAPPPGVLATARGGTPDKVTWQPRDGVRIAQVSVGWHGGAVTVGRSLREVERREDQLLLLVAAGLAATLVVLAVACVAAARWGPIRRD